ncbi:MAG: PA14 domain-containing protein [Anaerolineae bacterium]
MEGQRRIISLVLALAAVMVAFAAQNQMAQRNLSYGLLLFSGAAALFIYASRRSSLPDLEAEGAESPTAQGLAEESSRRILGFLLLSLSIPLNLLATYYFIKNANLSQAWAFYLLSMAFFPLAVRLVSRRDALPKCVVPSGRDWLLLVGILAVAAFMRLYLFDSLPFGTWYDEADNGLHALKILRDPTYRPIYVPSTNLPAHFLYLIAFSFKLFGVSTLSMRVVTVAMGVATVAGGYFLGRELLGARLAPALAFLLAVSRWDVNFSRISLHGVSTPLFEVWALYFLLRGLRPPPASPSTGGLGGELLDFAWGGLAVGLGLCFYAPYRLFPFVIALFLLYLLLTRRGFLKRHLFNLLFFLCGAFLAFGPVGGFALKNPHFWARTQRVSIFQTVPQAELTEALAENAAKHFLMFNYRGDPNGRHNLPGSPMLDFVSAALFALGLGYSLYHLGQARHFLLIIWLVVMLFGGIFSLPFEAPQSLRAIGTLPAAYALVCVPLAQIEAEGRRVLGCRGYGFLLAFLVPVLAYIGWDNYYTYFHVQARDFSVWNAFSTRETIIAQEVNRLGQGYDVYLTPVLTGHLTTRFLAPNFKEERILDPATTLPLTHSGQEGVALFVDDESDSVRALVEKLYPQAERKVFFPPSGGPTVLYLYVLSPAEVEELQGLPGLYIQVPGTSKAPGTFSWGLSHRLHRRDGPLDFDWTEETLLPLPFYAEWDGVLLVPAYGPYVLRFEVPGRVWMKLDGALLLSGEGDAEQEVMLAEGLHKLQINATISRKGVLRFLWRAQMPEVRGTSSTVYRLPSTIFAPIPRWAFFAPPVAAEGLVGSYFPNDRWEGPPAFRRIDPAIDFYFHLIPLPRPYTVEWRGQVEVPVSGIYGLGTEVRDACWLYLDDKLVLENAEPDHYKETTLFLEAGRHDLRLRFLDKTDHSHVYLYWTTPEGEHEIIPRGRLFPAEGSGWEMVRR